MTSSESEPDKATIGDARIAAISRHDGQSIGACLFLSADQLRLLNVQPGDVAAIKYIPMRIGGLPAIYVTDLSDSPTTNTNDATAD